MTDPIKRGLDACDRAMANCRALLDLADEYDDGRGPASLIEMDSEEIDLGTPSKPTP